MPNTSLAMSRPFQARPGRAVCLRSAIELYDRHRLTAKSTSGDGELRDLREQAAGRLR
jgi:hypothetical protein